MVEIMSFAFFVTDQFKQWNGHLVNMSTLDHKQFTVKRRLDQFNHQPD